MSRDDEYVFKPVDDDSPADSAIEFMSRKWPRTIVEVLLEEGSLRYSELDGISDKALSDALEGMEAMQIVDRDVVDDRPVKVEYSLTEVGQSLETVVEDFMEWKREYVEYVDSLDSDSTE